MTIRLPKQNIWKQSNITDRFADLWSSFNLDLTSKLGSLRVSPRFVLNMNDTDDADFGIPCSVKGFETSNSPSRLIYLLTGDHLFYSEGGIEDTWNKYASAPHPGNSLDADYSDMEVFNGTLQIFGTGTGIQRVNADGTTTAEAGILTTGAGLHACVYFRAQNRLYFIDDSSKSVGSMDTSYAVATLGNQYTLNDLVDGVNTYITWIRATSTRIWIGTINFGNGEGYIYAWDGSQASGPNEAYKLDTSGSFACVIKDDVPWVVDAEGRLLAFNGGTFVEKDRFPVDLGQGKYMPHVYKGTQRLVHYNGMTLVDNKINILANTAPYETGWPASVSLERMPSGVWEYTEETGLYPKASLGLTKVGGTITDYGAAKLKYVGVLSFVKRPTLSVTAGSINGVLVAGAEYFTTATASSKGVFYDDFANTLQKAGYFVTSKIFSENITETWQKFYLRFRKFLNSTYKVVVKARTEEDEPTEATITYVNTTSFTVLASAFTTNPAVGDEVEVLQGIGAGRTAHITAVTGTTTLTITVDETITGATTQTAIARFQTWKKLGSYNAQTDDFLKLPIDLSLVGSTPWLQIKCWFLWTGKNEIYDNIIASKVQERIE